MNPAMRKLLAYMKAQGARQGWLLQIAREWKAKGKRRADGRYKFNYTFSKGDLVLTTLRGVLEHFRTTAAATSRGRSPRPSRAPAPSPAPVLAPAPAPAPAPASEVKVGAARVLHVWVTYGKQTFCYRIKGDTVFSKVKRDFLQRANINQYVYFRWGDKQVEDGDTANALGMEDKEALVVLN